MIVSRSQTSSLPPPPFPPRLMASLYSKSSVFVRPHVNDDFKNILPGERFWKDVFFGHCLIPETHKGLKSVTRVQCLWIFILTIFGNLSDGYPFSTKWLLSDHHAGVLRQEFCISGLKYTVKRQKMERESSKECSAFFLWRKGSFSSRNRPSRNSTLFSSRRSPWSVLKCNQGSVVFAEFSGTFCTLWPRQLRF